MNIIEQYQDAPFSTYEAATLLKMGDDKRKAQVVAWTRRNLDPFEIDMANPKKKMMRLDLVNIFELYLIKILKQHHVKPAKINEVVGKEYIKEILLSSKDDFMIIQEGSNKPIFTQNPTMLFKLCGGLSSVIVVNLRAIKEQIFEGIKKVRA